MANEIDDRIVAIHFDNREFERNIADTIKSLADFRQSLDFSHAVRGLDDLAIATDGFDMSGMGEAIENISNKFSTMGAIGFAAIQNLTNSVLDFAKKTAGDILAPIISGGKRRAENIEQAKFQFRGLGMDVEAGMKSALDAVLGTAYGLDEAAKAAAQFGASGIKVGAQMTNALRGIAGVAAMTNTSFSEIAQIYTSSAGTGVINTQDLMQFATRGLNAAAALAKVLGKTEAQVREMASQGEISFTVFADAMNKAFGEHATKANETYSGSLANMRAAMSRLGASFFAPQQMQQRDLFNALGPAIDKVHKAILPLISSFIDIRRYGIEKAIGFIKNLNFDNFTKAIEKIAAGLRHGFQGILNFIGMIKDAFRDIFPASTVSQFLKFAVAFEAFTQKLKIGGETLDKFKSVFRGLFAIVEIGWTVIKEIAILFKELFNIVKPAGGTVLSFSASIGNMATKLNEALVAGGGIHRFFVRVREVIAAAIVFIRSIDEKFDELKNKLIEFKEKTKDVFGSITDSKQVEGSIGRIGSRMDHLSSAWERFQDRMQGVNRVLDKVWELIKDWFASLGSKIADAFQPGDFNAAVDIVNVGLLGGIAVMLQRFLSGGFLKVGSGFLDKISGALDTLTTTLKNMQLKVKAEAILKIAIAMAILTASLVVLSLIDSAALTKAMVAIATGFGMLVGAMTLMEKHISHPTRIAILSASLIAMATALAILSVSILLLSKLDPDELAVGIAGISAGLALLVGAMKLISTDAKGLITATAAMIGMAGALVAISGVVKIFSTMSLGELAKGMGAMALSIATLVGATLLMSTNPAGLIAGTAAIIGMAGALVAISGVVKIFSTMSLGELAKGLGAMAAGLGLLVGVTYLMSTNPAGLIAGAAAMVLMAGALNIMASAILLLGQGGVDTLAKGLGAMVIILAALSAAMLVMMGTLPAAAALVVAAGALHILANVLERLGELSIAQIATGLVAIAAVLGVLSGLSIALAPVIPGLLAMGGALIVVGAGFALFGAGAYLVAKAFEAIAKAGPAGMKAVVEMLEVFGAAAFNIGKTLAVAVIGFVTEIVGSAPLLVRMITALLLQLLETVTKLAPEIAKAIVVIVTEAITLIKELFPQIVTLGFTLLLMFLQGIRDHIGEIIAAGTEIIVAFILGITNAIVQIVGAITTLITTFISTIGDNTQRIIDAGFKLLTDMIKGIADNIHKVAETVVTIIEEFFKAIGDNSQRIIDGGIAMVNKLIEGLKKLGSSAKEWIDAGVEIAGNFLDAVAEGIIKLSDRIAKVVINFLNGMADVIRENDGEIRDAAMNLAGAVIDGLTGGLASKAGDVAKGGVNIGKKVLGGIGGALKVWSPSRETFKLGKYAAEGLAIALNNDTSVEGSAHELGNRALTGIKEALSQIPDSLAGMDEFNPVITPVLDLTKVQAASGDISKLMKVPALVPTVSIDSASVISRTATRAEDITPIVQSPSEVKFEQNIYAPEALSTNDIYRNTKSQIALAKEKLGI